jgi:hypothetical protein
LANALTSAICIQRFVEERRSAVFDILGRRCAGGRRMTDDQSRLQCRQ